MRHRRWQKNNPDYVKRYREQLYLKSPWILTLYGIKNRTKFSPSYRNIKCLITKDELKKLWIRDNANIMKQPSIDRIDTCGHYSFDNCRYIEMQENISRPKKKK